MQGMQGVSGAASMPRNCGMDGMHGNTQKRQVQNEETNAVKQQSNKTNKIPNDILGNKIDVKI